MIFLYESIKNGYFFGGKMLENHTIVRLNAEFFEKHKEHTEILSKPERPHLVVLNMVKFRTVFSSQIQAGKN